MDGRVWRGREMVMEMGEGGFWEEESENGG